MLWESSKMEQRNDAVLGVIRDGLTVIEVGEEVWRGKGANICWSSQSKATLTDHAPLMT